MSRAGGSLLGIAALALLWKSDASSSSPAEQTLDELEPGVNSPLVSASQAKLEVAAMGLGNGQGARWDVFFAICDTETGRGAWDTQAVNLGPGDEALGGAYGAAQLTYKTALRMDDVKPTAWSTYDVIRGQSTLLLYPELVFILAARVVADAQRQVQSAGGTDADIASIYNSGKLLNRAPASTLDVYVPRFTENLRLRRAGAGA